MKYAKEINEWNYENFGTGFITKFHVKKEFVDLFDKKIVGEAHHEEWWIPADQLEELNINIVGNIEIIE